MNKWYRGSGAIWAKLNSVIGESGANLAGHHLEHVLQELPCRLPVCFVDQLGHGKLACAIDPDERKQFFFSGLHLGDVDAKEIDGIAFERLALRLVTLHIRQLGNAFAVGLEPIAPQWLIATGNDAALSVSDAGWIAA